MDRDRHFQTSGTISSPSEDSRHPAINQEGREIRRSVRKEENQPTNDVAKLFVALEEFGRNNPATDDFFTNRCD